MTAIMTEPQAEQITLYYREGSSDKTYQISLEFRGEGFVVNFAYGRRGTTLQTGTKTSSPVNYETAKGIYDKLIREKQAKGYTEGPDGTPYQHTVREDRATGILPQLLNPIEESLVQRFLEDPGYCAQEKYDGRRILIRKDGAEIHGINRKGLIVGLPENIFGATRSIPGDFVLDGECVGDVYYAFDMLQGPGFDLRAKAYQQRLIALLNLLGLAMQKHIRCAETAFAPGQKRDLFNWLRREKREGIVFKRLDAPYTAGRPNSGGPQIKNKFYATCSTIVSKINDKRSVELRLLNGQGFQPVGNVTIPVNFEVPQVGQVVEVRYLYAFRESNALYQPVYLGPRDVEVHECVLSQLKYKAEAGDEA